MRSPGSRRMSPSALFYFTLLAVTGFSAVIAQDLPTLTGTTNNAIPTAAAPTGGSDNTKEASQGTDETLQTTPDTKGDQTPTGTLPDITSLAGSTDESAGTPPSLTSDGDKPDAPKLNDLPTLTGAYDYPPPSVPPTAKAPYMQQSKLPEGTVFIGVGAALGFFALVIIAWRGLVAWSINRSVRRSAAKGYSAVAESSYDKGDKKKTAPYSSVAPAGSTISLDKLSSSNRTGTVGSKAPRENSSLFFSPTAGAGLNSPGNRNSGYLPSGYYASSNAAPGGGAGMTMVGGTGDRGSKLRPHSGVYASTRTFDPSPPDSPDIRSSTAGVSARDSRSSLNLSSYTNNRAPSTYLDDLMSTPPHPPHADASGRRKRDGSGRN